MELSKDRLEALIGQSTDIVVATDRKGIVVYYNDGASKSLGYAPGEVLGTYVGRLYPSIEEAKRVKYAMRSAGFGGLDTADTVETRFLAKGGEEIPVAISCATTLARKTARSASPRTCARYCARRRWPR